MGVNPIAHNIDGPADGAGSRGGNDHDVQNDPMEELSVNEAVSGAVADFAASDDNPLQLTPTSSVATLVVGDTGLQLVAPETPVSGCSYIADDSILFFLASVTVDHNAQTAPAVFGPAPPPQGLPLVPYPDSDYDVREVQGPLLTTPSKRRSCKLKEPLDDVFLRRGKRLNPDLDGFRNATGA
ncbi:hypothetical protein BAE44_0012414 [Dichanthelium oligosanthes]|uniref:Uncharacterized protein n=1 Tax=Dichanthelium oligosanthes TaxID=888268 RepID=A0A1E5VN67_9POAL|nr:hypothetical protein BAE44_0012414 [Dichanthelium oligosanthes]